MMALSGGVATAGCGLLVTERWPTVQTNSYLGLIWTRATGFKVRSGLNLSKRRTLQPRVAVPLLMRKAARCATCAVIIGARSTM